MHVFQLWSQKTCTPRHGEALQTQTLSLGFYPGPSTCEATLLYTASSLCISLQLHFITMKQSQNTFFKCLSCHSHTQTINVLIHMQSIVITVKVEADMSQILLKAVKSICLFGCNHLLSVLPTCDDSDDSPQKQRK